MRQKRYIVPFRQPLRYIFNSVLIFIMSKARAHLDGSSVDIIKLLGVLGISTGILHPRHILMPTISSFLVVRLDVHTLFAPVSSEA